MMQTADDRERLTRLYRVKQVCLQGRAHALSMGGSQRRETRARSSDWGCREAQLKAHYYPDPSESACRRLPSFQWSRSAFALPPLSSGKTLIAPRGAER
jgi:hypothetical protein